jgi:hypothetical protein
MTTEQRLVERVTFRDSDHTYKLDGKKIPSVTTLLGNLSKPALPWWAAKMGAEAAVDFLDRRFDDEGMAFIGHHERDEVFNLVQRAHMRKATDAAAKGSVVHNAIEQFHTNFFTAEPPEDDPRALAAWNSFLEWWATAGLTCVSTERIIVDPDGRYSGRLDLLCEDAHSNWYVCDVKTSNGIYPEMILQNAGYASAIEGETGREVAGTKVLWLPEGAEKLTVVERDREEWQLDYTIFEALIPIHAHRKALDKWLRGVKAEHGPTKDEAE